MAYPHSVRQEKDNRRICHKEQQEFEFQKLESNPCYVAGTLKGTGNIIHGRVTERTLRAPSQLKGKYVWLGWDPWVGPKNVKGKLKHSHVEANEPQ